MRLTIGCSWPGAASEVLHRELEPLAKSLGADSIQVKTLPETALRDHLMRRPLGATGEALDLAIVPNHFLSQLAGRGVLAEVPLSLSDRVAAVILPAAWGAVSDGPRAVAVPVGSEVVALLYNPELVPNPPRSLRELLRVAASRPGVFPYSVNIEDPLSLFGYVNAEMNLSDGDSRESLAVSRDHVSRVLGQLTMPSGEPAPSWLFGGLSLESLQVQLFAEGRLVALLVRPRLLGALELLDVQVAVVPPPPLEPGGDAVEQLVSYDCLVVSADSPWVDLAFRLIELATSDEVHHRLNAATRNLPVLTSSYRMSSPVTAGAQLGFLRTLEQGVTFPLSEGRGETFHGFYDTLQQEARAHLHGRSDIDPEGRHR